MSAADLLGPGPGLVLRSTPMICSSLKRLPLIARLLFRRRTLPHFGGVFGGQARSYKGDDLVSRPGLEPGTL